MKYKNITVIAFGVLALGLSTAGSAAAVTDTIDATDAQANTYFTPDDASKTNWPYYRWYGDDWSWTHNAIGGTITSASLNISAYDVDAPDEVDEIYAWNTDGAGSWDLLGSLAGATDVWSFTSFNLAASWFDEIAAGLKVMMVIDALDDGWAVSLAKSSLEVNGGTLPPPTPGEVPVPAALWLFASGLVGFMGMRRKAKLAVK